MDRSGRIGEERREAKPEAPPPSGGGKRPNPAPEESLLPSGNVNPDEAHEPENPAKTSAA
jgi:hypothetical protein